MVTLPHSLHLLGSSSCYNTISPYTLTNPGVSAAEIEQIIEAEKQSGAQVVVGCQRRAPRLCRTQKHFVTSKEPARWAIGTFDFSSYPNWDKTWRNDPKLSGDPAKSKASYWTLAITLSTAYSTF